MAIEVQLLGTLGCHLCEQAEQLLMPWLARDVVVELLDIAESEALVARYGLRIPV
nr:glutaredoxin family protein [Pseudomonas sp.]